MTDTAPTSPLARFDALFTTFQRPILAYAMRRSATQARRHRSRVAAAEWAAAF